MILTKRKAVEQYGNQSQKSHFEKYGRIVSKNVEASLFKTLEQYYESVERVTRGRAVDYEVSGERETPAPRKTLTALNGSWSIPYSHHIDLMMIHYLSNHHVDGIVRSSLSQLLILTGIHTPFQRDILSLHSQSKIAKEFREKYNEEAAHFFISKAQSIHQQVSSSLKRLERIGIIDLEINQVAIGNTIREQSNTGEIVKRKERIELSDDQAAFFSERKRDILKTNETNAWSIASVPKSKKAERFKEDYGVFLESELSPKVESKTSISYVYKEYHIRFNQDVDPLALYSAIYPNVDISLKAEVVRQDFLVLREKYLRESLSESLKKLSIQLLPAYDEEWGCDAPVRIREKASESKDYFYELVLDGKADDLLAKIIDMFLHWTPVPSKSSQETA